MCWCCVGIRLVVTYRVQPPEGRGCERPECTTTLRPERLTAHHPAPPLRLQPAPGSATTVSFPAEMPRSALRNASTSDAKSGSPTPAQRVRSASKWSTSRPPPPPPPDGPITPLVPAPPAGDIFAYVDDAAEMGSAGLAPAAELGTENEPQRAGVPIFLLKSRSSSPSASDSALQWLLWLFFRRGMP